jgi:hypothetical protein
MNRRFHSKILQAILRWSIVVLAVLIASGVNGYLTIQDELADAEYRRMKHDESY